MARPRSSVDPTIRTLILFTVTAFAILVPFVVVPEIMERKGYDPKSRFARGVVWVSFLLVVFLPALASGFVFTVQNPADWGLLVVVMVVAILYDYYRLNPGRVPWARPKA